MGATPRFGLPFLEPGQAQKELFHNEALQTIDTLLNASVEEGPLREPPEAVDAGACFIVAKGAVGAWEGKDGCLASLTAGGWRFTKPQEGTSVYVKREQLNASFRSGEWSIGSVPASSVVVGGEQVLGRRQNAVPSPEGGKVVDAEARTSLNAILAALRTHGLIAS